MVSNYLEDLGEDGGGEEGGVLDDNEVTLVLIGHLKLVQDGVCGLAHNHSAEQLASQPCATAWGDSLLDDCHLHIVQDIRSGIRLTLQSSLVLYPEDRSYLHLV